MGTAQAANYASFPSVTSLLTFEVSERILPANLMHILNAISHIKLRNTLTFALESQMGSLVTPVATAGEAIEVILRNPGTYQFILSDHPMIAQPFVKFLSAMKITVPMAIVLPEGAVPPDEYLQMRDMKILGYLQGDDTLQSLLKMVEALRKNFAHIEKEVELPETEFCRVASDLVRDQEPLSADLYLQVANAKFSKILGANERFNAGDREKYFVERQVEYLYVRKEDCAALLDRFNGALNRAMAVAERNPDEAAKVAGEIHNATMDMIARLGITPEVRSLIKANILLTVKTLGANPKLRSMLAKISTNRDKYISSHSMALAQLSCAIAAAVEWGSVSTFQKLTMAAFLHDIVLTNQELAQAQTRDELDVISGQYTRVEIRDYTLHPTRAAAIARHFDEVPPDVDSIIAQHHERPDGSGFPRGLSRNQIAPLAALFIVTHDIVSSIYAGEGSFDMVAFLEDRILDYSSGNFKKIYTVLKDMKL